MIQIFNLITQEIQEFSHDDPVAAVVSAYCEEKGLMSWLTSFVMEPPERNPRHNPAAFPEIAKHFVRGKLSVACGNWAVLAARL